MTIVCLSGCTGGGIFGGRLFRDRAQETPAPNDETIEKSFFVNTSGKPKTFLCGMAPIVGTTPLGEKANLPGYNRSEHCNVEFKITQDFLIGLKVNPSFPDNRDRWSEFVRIPIVKHFYYEKAKDEFGRDTNQNIENEARSHWSARPKMRLRLSGLMFGGVSSGDPREMRNPSMQISSVDDIEWDRSKTFLGFTINSTQTYTTASGPIAGQTKFRVNFLMFEHDPTFKKIPYSPENGRFFNILHIMGKSVNGFEPVLYAGHWDLRKPTPVYISGAPEETKPLIAKAVYHWNREFQKIGAVAKDFNPFIPKFYELKYPFDLRYTSIIYNNDKRIGMVQEGLMGIGLAHADIRTAKFFGVEPRFLEECSSVL